MARRDNRRGNNQAESDLKEKLVNLSRVAKVTKGGRTFSFSALVVVGDGNGKVGHGLGKARDVSESISKAVDDAKKNLVEVPVYNGTIPHEQKGKYGGGRNVLAKSQGSSNPHNVVKATVDALMKLRSPLQIAKERNISLEKLFEG